MRILHVNDLPLGPGGGVEVYLTRLMGAQRAAGHDVDLFSAEASHTGARRLLDVWDRTAAERLRTVVAQTRPDVVHFHNVVRELSPSVIGATDRVPAVATVHDLRVFGGLEHHLPDPRAAVDRALLGPLVRRQMRAHVSALVAVSEAVRRHVAGYGFADAVVVPVPVPPPVVAPRPLSDCHDVVFVGRLTRDKGPHVLVAAFHAIADEHPEARLVMAGAGPERAALEGLAPSGRVVFTGALDPTGVSEVLGRARVVVTPSIPGLRREGSSLTTAEAARHGRPVVTSDDPAVAEVTETVGGQVVPAGDVGALAGALRHWLADPASAVEAGEQAARAATAAYDVDAVQVAMDDVYRQLCHARA